MNYTLPILAVAIAATVLPGVATASTATGEHLDLTDHWVGTFTIVVFSIAYLLVMAEEFTHLRKSKPVIIAAGVIWGLIAAVYAGNGLTHEAEAAVRHNLLEYSELMLFLLVWMTYINAMDDRRVFDALRSWLVRKGFSYRQLFWLTGLLAFFISPVADNLTTALLMCAVVLAVGGDNMRFVSLACINIVIAANAGGAFSPFGDITTLMVWQKGIVDFWTFFALFMPSVVNFLVPAAIMHFAIPKEKPDSSNDRVAIRRGVKQVIALFLLTIITAVSFHNLLHLPPVIGMVSELMYSQWGATTANVSVGLLSAIVDNIPIMFAVLAMNPDMSTGQWLLVTLTAGVGGSLLSIGSAAGVALMGQARGKYTFFNHLKWTPVIALGYAASIYMHIWINSGFFN